MLGKSSIKHLVSSIENGRYQWLDIQVQCVSYVAEREASSFSKVKDATSSVLLSVGTIHPENMGKYGKSRKTTEFGSGKSRRLAGYMAFWRNNSSDTFV
jgi:hypothetical protein